MSTILSRTKLVNREVFDPKNKEHIKSFKCFVDTGNWGDIQFFEEAPFTTVPDTVTHKYLKMSLKEHTMDVHSEDSIFSTTDEYTSWPIFGYELADRTES